MSAFSLVEQLIAVGEAIHGAEWQRRIAADLGPYHPRGTRERLDDRLVRRWVAGDRPVPTWVGDVLPRILAFARFQTLRRIDDTARRLGYDDLVAVALSALVDDLRAPPPVPAKKKAARTMKPAVPG